MTDLIPINYENPERPTVSGRELYDFLHVDSNYTTWFKRMCDYGFTENEDYVPFLENRSDGLAGKPRTDHQLTIPMAKEIAMIQRNERGKIARQYFIKIEEQWNSPDAIMQRALLIANARVKALQETVAIQTQQIAEMQPKVSYYDVVLQTPDALPVSVIAKDYGWSAQKMNQELRSRHIQYQQGRIWLLYQEYAEQGYTVTKTSITEDANGTSHSHVHTYWTQKGRLFIYDLLKKDRILPLIERKPEAA